MKTDKQIAISIIVLRRKLRNGMNYVF